MLRSHPNCYLNRKKEKTCFSFMFFKMFLKVSHRSPQLLSFVSSSSIYIKPCLVVSINNPLKNQANLVCCIQDRWGRQGGVGGLEALGKPRLIYIFSPFSYIEEDIDCHGYCRIYFSFSMVTLYALGCSVHKQEQEQNSVGYVMYLNIMSPLAGGPMQLLNDKIRSSEQTQPPAPLKGSNFVGQVLWISLVPELGHSYSI